MCIILSEFVLQLLWQFFHYLAKKLHFQLNPGLPSPQGCCHLVENKINFQEIQFLKEFGFKKLVVIQDPLN